jgi:hypothetical protein
MQTRPRRSHRRPTIRAARWRRLGLPSATELPSSNPVKGRPRATTPAAMVQAAAIHADSISDATPMDMGYGFLCSSLRFVYPISGVHMEPANNSRWGRAVRFYSCGAYTQRRWSSHTERSAVLSPASSRGDRRQPQIIVTGWLTATLLVWPRFEGN